MKGKYIRLSYFFSISKTGSKPTDYNDFRIISLRKICVLILICILAATYLPAQEQSVSKPKSKPKIAPIEKQIKLIKPTDINGKDMSGDEQICIVNEATKRPIIFRVMTLDNQPMANVSITYEIVFPADDSAKSISLEPVSGKMTTDEEGYFKVNVTVGKKEGKVAIIFFAGNGQEDITSFASIEFIINVKRDNWGNWMILWLFGAMGLLLLGMKIGSDGLMGLAGVKMRKILSTVTTNPIWGLGSGAVMTVFTQSSSATSSILVNLVKAGLLSFRQSIAVLFGAAVGTTIIVQIISFNVSDYALPMIAIGVVMLLVAKNSKISSLGYIIIGFGLIFYSMFQMQVIISPLREFQFFTNAVQTIAHSKGWCLILAAIFTAICHSSGATLGIAISLAANGFLDLSSTIPIILGANIGTTSTALMVSIGTTPDAKRVGWANLTFKTVGVIILLPFMNQIADVCIAVTKFLSELPLPLGANNVGRQIANTHTIVNCFWAIFFLPFIGLIERFVRWIVPDIAGQTEVTAKYLTLNIDDSPATVIGSTLREISRMGRFVEEMMRIVGDAFFEKKESLSVIIQTKEDKVDSLRFSITQFLIDFTRKDISAKDTQKVIKLIFIVSDLENIGDIIFRNLLPLAKKMVLNDRRFSEEGEKELKELHKNVSEELSKIIIALTTGDETLAQAVSDNRKIFFKKADQLHLSHIRRFREGLQESLDTSTIHLDFINYMMRIEYYVSSIASLVSEQSARSHQIDLNSYFNDVQ